MVHNWLVADQTYDILPPIMAEIHLNGTAVLHFQPNILEPSDKIFVR